MQELSTQDFYVFKEAIVKYLKKYSLLDWDYSVVVCHELGGWACIDPNLGDRSVKILINSEIDHETDNVLEFLEKLAHHEVLELLFVEMNDIMYEHPECPQDRIDTIRHAVINRIINRK